MTLPDDAQARKAASLIGIAGHKQAGKTMLAELLAPRLGLEHDSFAGPIREMVARILGISPEALEVCKERPHPVLGGKTPREAMQTLGTEWGRDRVYHALWIESLFHRLGDGGGIVSDVRFPNEAEAIRQRGGIVLRLTRPGHQSEDPHRSEHPLPDRLVDHELLNDGPAFELVEEALRLIAGESVEPINPVAQDTGD